MAGGINNSLLFDSADAGTCAPMRGAAALAYLHKNQRAVRGAHHQVNLTAATAGCAKVALDELESGVLQVALGLALRRVPTLFGAADGGSLFACQHRGDERALRRLIAQHPLIFLFFGKPH